MQSPEQDRPLGEHAAALQQQQLPPSPGHQQQRPAVVQPLPGPPHIRPPEGAGGNGHPPPWPHAPPSELSGRPTLGFPGPPGVPVQGPSSIPGQGPTPPLHGGFTSPPGVGPVLGSGPTPGFQDPHADGQLEHEHGPLGGALGTAPGPRMALGSGPYGPPRPFASHLPPGIPPHRPGPPYPVPPGLYPPPLLVPTRPGFMPEGPAPAVKHVDVAEDAAGQDAADWTAHNANGVIYYFNARTGQSTYTKPKGFKGESTKVNAQPRPVSVDKVKGTGWAIVHTDDGKKYYYNAKTKETSWQVPAELADRTAQPTGKEATSAQEPVAEAQPVKAPLEAVKKKLADASVAPSTPPEEKLVLPIPEAPPAHKAESESSEEEEEEAAQPEIYGKKLTKEERAEHFRDMLKEKGVLPFSKWEKELPKIIYDPRFKARAQRRALFEHYVKTRAEEERKERRAALRIAVDGFRQLLDEATEVITWETKCDDLAQTWGDDPRFNALEPKEREAILLERTLPLRKAEEEKKKERQLKAEREFLELLGEHNVKANARWFNVKEELADDPRYEALGRDERERLFVRHVRGLEAAESEARKAVADQQREEERLRAHEREERKRKERDEEENDKRRAKLRKQDAVDGYQQLLAEKVTSAEVTWSDVRRKLEQDERFDAPDLDASEQERLFKEYYAKLVERCKQDYRELLSEKLSARFWRDKKPKSWSDAKHMLRGDDRYSGLPRTMREVLFQEHIDSFERKEARHDRDSRRDRDGRDQDTEKEHKPMDWDRERVKRDRLERSNKDRDRDRSSRHDGERHRDAEDGRRGSDRVRR
eukprot:jgi/Chlat1/7925/Chrsp68S07386